MIIPIHIHLQEENRRLRELNARLLDALRAVVNEHDTFDYLPDDTIAYARAAVKRAEQQ